MPATHSAPALHAEVGQCSKRGRCSLCAKTIPPNTPTVFVAWQPIALAQRWQAWHLACARHLAAVFEAVFAEARY